MSWIKIDELDFETLCQVLMNPSKDMGIYFVEALFFIQKMSNDEHFEELSEQAKANNISVHDKFNSYGFGIGIMATYDPKLLKRPHTEVMILKPKSFKVFPVGSKAS